MADTIEMAKLTSVKQPAFLRKIRDAYTGDRFGHFAHDSDVPGVDFGLTHFLGVHVEPEVV